MGHSCSKLFCYSFISVAALFLISGCGQQPTVSHPLMIRAESYVRQEKYDEAAKDIKQYLLVNPESAYAHRRLAQIYDENLDRPELAVYHYTLCLEINPYIIGHGDVKKYLASARRRTYDRMKKEYNDRKTVDYLSRKIKEFKTDSQKNSHKKDQMVKVVAAYKRYIFKVNKEKKKLQLELNSAKTLAEITKEKNSELKNNIDILKAQIEKLKAQIPESEVKTSETDKAPPLEPTEKVIQPEKIQEVVSETPTRKNLIPERSVKPVEMQPHINLAAGKMAKNADDSKQFPDIKTVEETPEKKTFYTVQQGDTLSSIARKFYGSARHFNILLEANKKILPDASKLRVNQVLTIPEMKKK